MIPYTYCIRKDIVFDEDGNKHTVYGIEAINSNGKILVSLPDVFFDKQKALEFIDSCNRNELSLNHLDIVVEDILRDPN